MAGFRVKLMEINRNLFCTHKAICIGATFVPPFITIGSWPTFQRNVTFQVAKIMLGFLRVLFMVDS